MYRDSKTALVGYFLCFVTLLIIILSWSIATPPMASPDEPNQVIQAAALVRGQLDTNRAKTPGGLEGIVRVPEYIAKTALVPGCFAFRPSVAANCAPGIGVSQKVVTATTPFTNYPPLYYALSGLPTLVLRGMRTIYAMRFLSALCNAAFLALGLSLLLRYHRNRLTLLGGLISITPMVLFLAAVVSSSGLEITSAFAAWCGGLCVVDQQGASPPPLTAATALAFGVLILCRPISPAIAVLILLTLIILSGTHRCSELFSSGSTKVVLVTSATAAILAGAFLVFGGAPILTGFPMHPPLSQFQAVEATVRFTGSRLRQAIGDFGWLDTPTPLSAALLWSILIALVVVYGLTMSRRCRRALLVLSLAVFLMPIILESPKINAVGAYWQGRYWLPLLVGVPLVASTPWPRVPWPRRLSRYVPVVALFIAGTAGVAQLISFRWALHRYQSGIGHTLIHWQPPIPATALTTLQAGGVAMFAAYVVWRSFMWKRPRLVSTSVASSQASETRLNSVSEEPL